MEIEDDTSPCYDVDLPSVSNFLCAASNRHAVGVDDFVDILVADNALLPFNANVDLAPACPPLVFALLEISPSCQARLLTCLIDIDALA